MRRVSLSEFLHAIKGMQHVGFASPDVSRGWFDRVEYFEGDDGEAEMRVLADGSEQYFVSVAGKAALEEK